jgi:hypothetical protein
VVGLGQGVLRAGYEVKGIIFNLLEHVVTDEFGEEAWEGILDAAGVEGAYTAVGTYPHEDLHQLVSAASTAVGMPQDDLIRWFGRRAIPPLAARYPDFFAPYTSTIPFVLTLNDVIHPEVRKLFPGAYAPEFDFESVDENCVALGYRSFRQLCPFAEGLVEGVADHYVETVTIEQTQCARRGDEKCVLVCRTSAVSDDGA